MITIGIDLGGSNIKAVLLDELGNTEEERILPTEAGKENISDIWKDTISELVHEFRSLSDEPVKAIGIAAPGIPDAQNSYIKSMPERLKGLENLNWSEFLDQDNVFVINDAHAALIAESKFGVGKGLKNIVMLMLGTGVGGSIMINGELYTGIGQVAGHIGHMVINEDDNNPGIVGLTGTLEQAIGDYSVSARSLGRYHSTAGLVEAYRKGEPFATYLWLDSVRKLVLALHSLYNILSPEMIILGGGITKSGSDLYEPLKVFMDLYEWKGLERKMDIKQARFADFSGAVGAAGYAFSRV